MFGQILENLKTNNESMQAIFSRLESLPCIEAQQRIKAVETEQHGIEEWLEKHDKKESASYSHSVKLKQALLVAFATSFTTALLTYIVLLVT